MAPTVVVDFSPLSTPTRARGIGRYLQTLALGLSRLEPRVFHGLEVRALLSVGWRGQYRVSDDFTDVLRHAWPQEPTQRDRYRWAYARRLGMWSAVRRLDASLVHLGDPNATPLGMTFSKCKRVVTCHDLIPLQFPSAYLGVRDGFGVVGKQILHRRYRSADHVVAISDATRDELMRLIDVPARKITRVYNGVDLAGWSPEDPGDDSVRVERLGLQSGRFLVYAGDTDWRKNPEGMLRGMAVAREQGADVELAFVGRLEPRKVASIQQQAARAGVYGSVHLLGYVSDSDLRALYRTALAHLFVSRSEGFGYTVIEAMASGCPVITTNCGSLAEVAGDVAMLVDPEDPQRIGHAIVEIERDASRRSGLVERGIRWAQCFSCEKQASAMLDVFRRLTD